MNLRQLRLLCKVVDTGFNITRAAEALYTSQPGISKQLGLLERELGVEILTRRGNRISGLSAPGQAVLNVARRVINDVQNLKLISQDFGMKDVGRLVVATTHTHARYALLDVTRRFRNRYPKVKFVIHQEKPAKVVELVAAGEADIGVTAPGEPHEDILMFPCYRLKRILLTRPGHPLLHVRPLTIRSVSRYPIITLDASFAGGKIVLEAFKKAGLIPNIAMTATDVDVLKSYAEIGLGVAIAPSIAYSRTRDRGLRAADVDHLFDHSIACIMLRRNQYLLPFIADFVCLIAPRWTHKTLENALRSGEIPQGPIDVYAKRARGNP